MFEISSVYYQVKGHGIPLLSRFVRICYHGKKNKQSFVKYFIIQIPVPHFYAVLLALCTSTDILSSNVMEESRFITICA